MTSYIYWRDSDTKDTSIDDLPDTQKIEFGNNDIEITSITASGKGNVITEPEFTPTGTKTYNKQEAGAIGESVTIISKFPINQIDQLKRLRSFFRKKQLDYPDFPYGIIGLSFDMFDYWNVDPSSILGYTMDIPIPSFGTDVENLTVTIHLSLGGKNLV